MGRLRQAAPVAYVSLIAPLVSVLAAQSRPVATVPSTADVAAVATPATVTILALGAGGDTLALGSGFVVRESGVVVTNYHVLRGASAAVVALPSREAFTRVTVLDADSTIDLALLKIPGAGLPVLQTRATTPRVGEKVIAIGSPLGLSQTVSEGIVSATRMIGGHEIVQITAPISHGSSGGAVLDADGRVFAVSTSLLAEGQAINFAIPVRYALGLLGNDPRPRQIADVFAVVAADRSPSGAAASDATTRRADPPRASVAGVYRVVHRIRATPRSPSETHIGFLIASNNAGLIALAPIMGRDSLGPTHIYDVTRWATTTNGDVVLVVGRTTWDGYQTADGGFIAAGQLATGSGTSTYTIGGVPAALPLSRNDGLFAARSRTYYRTPRGDMTRIKYDWRGELAIAFAHDTLYASLYLTNDQGGSVSFHAHGPLVDHESFDLQDARGTRLRGSVRNGVLSAKWEDVRSDGAAFVGNFNAERK